MTTLIIILLILLLLGARCRRGIIRDRGGRGRVGF